MTKRRVNTYSLLRDVEKTAVHTQTKPLPLTLTTVTVQIPTPTTTSTTIGVSPMVHQNEGKHQKMKKIHL